MAESLTRDFAQDSALVASTAASIDRNRDCTCLTLDRKALGEALIRETGDPSFCTSLMETRSHLFADVAVFVSETQLDRMRLIVAAIETVSRHPA